MRYLFVSGISDASCNLPYRGRNIQHRVCGRSVAHNVGASCLIENIAPLKGRRGVEIDFAGFAAGCTYRETVYLLFVAVVTLAALRTDYLYLVGGQFRMANHLADKCHAVHEKVQVKTDLLRNGISA